MSYIVGSTFSMIHFKHFDFIKWFDLKVPTHYWIVCLYSKNVSYYVFIPDKFFNLFRNMFTTKTIEINNFTCFDNFIHLWNNSELSFFLNSLGENKLVYSVNFLPTSIKSMNPMQKYPHVTELFACTRKMLAIMSLFLINSLISSGTCSIPKLSK